VIKYPSNQSDRQIVLVDERPLVFFDNRHVHWVSNVTRRLNHPVKHGDSIIRSDQPWEHITYFTCNTWNVIYDPQDKLFKCWYEDWDWKKWGQAKYMDCALLLAVSRDGVKWDKPGLGVNKIDGRDTNIVVGRDDFGYIHAPTVFLDHAEQDPEKRFKLIFKRHLPRPARPDQTYGNEIISFEMMTSPDGIHWSLFEQSPLVPDRLDGDVLIAQRDPITGRISLAGRSHASWSCSYPPDHSFFTPHDPSEPFGHTKRNVWWTESEDGLTWTPAFQALRCDDHDNLDDGFYGLNHFRVGRHNVGILNFLHGVDNTMDIELVYSEDNWQSWSRPFRNIPYIARGDSENDWDHLMLTSCSAPVNHGDETLVYYAGANNHHDWWMYADMGPDVPEKANLDMVDFRLGLARLRRDGFVSMDVGPLDGVLVTNPLERGGERLVINAKCGPDGYIASEIQETYGRAWPGYSRGECDIFTGDAAEHVVTWSGNCQIAPAGKYLKLAFYMKNAKLYSITMK